MSSLIAHSSFLETQSIDANLELPNFKSSGYGQPSGLVNPAANESTLANTIVKDYLRGVEPIFRGLDDLRQKGWRNPEGDKYFDKLQKMADSANNDTEGTKFFYKMNKNIGNELHASTGAFTVINSHATPIRALNLCMAPGGYTWSLLKVNPSARISGITLPSQSGGHPMLLPFGDEDPRVEVKFMDITMLASEFGVSTLDIPPDHPDAATFSAETPYQDLSFDIVLCDGQVLRTHDRAECRRHNSEPLRLLTAQLIIAMKRIKAGGTMIILLHKVDRWETVKLLKTFDVFSKICLFKPKRVHGQRSSFYLVAKDVQPRHPEAINSVAKWKRDWWLATFGGEGFTGERVEEDEEEVVSVLESFGSRLVELGKEIWSIQSQALRKAPYVK